MQIKSSRLVYAGIVLLFLILTAGISSADDVNVELVGHFGGIFNNVVVAGNYAYIGQGHDLVVLDITDVNKRSEVGRVATPSVFNIVAVSGNCAYVIGEGVLSVVDISNPSLPTLTGSYDTADYANGIAVSGNYAYVTSTVYLDDAYESRLEIVDITNPSSPTLAGSYDTAAYVSGIAVAGNYAYVAGGNGLAIIDISNPASPIIVGSFDTLDYARGVAVLGNYAYLTDRSGLVIVDISNPSLPTFGGSCDIGTENVNIVAVVGNYVYLTAIDVGLIIVNVTNPSSPKINGIYMNDFLLGAVVSGNYAYAVDYVAGGLYIVDISNPSSPTLADIYGGSTNGIAVSGNYAYVAVDIGLEIVDISNPSSPTLAGSYGGYASDVAVSDNYAYAIIYGGLFVVDISNPSSPTLAGSYYGSARDVAVSGNYAYVAGHDNSLVIFDISNPASPIIVGSFDTLDNARDVAVSGNYVYVADSENGLVIVNITNPSSPTLAGSYYIGNYVSGIAVSGNYAYIVGDGLFVVDISNPSSPTLAGSYGGYAHGIAVSGNYAYVVGYDNGLFVVDISNPSSPTLAGSFDTLDNARDVAVSGNYVYVADSENSLVILRVETVSDTIPPASVTNLKESSVGSNWINWAWKNPKDVDFSHVMVYLNGAFVTNTSGSFYNSTGLAEGTTHSISTKTVDTSNNINSTWVNDSATTTVPADTTPPVSVTNLKETGVGPSWINWTWVNPTDADFNHVMVYLDGAFVTNTSGSFYNSTGLAEGTTYTISTKTVDTSGNINTAQVNDSATTTSQKDTTPPASITNLKETEAGQNWVRWTWVNPRDADFSHVIVYVDYAFVTNTSGGFYNATGLGDVYISDLNLKDEWVRVKNLVSSSVDLTGWEIKDEGDIHTYTFPSFQLGAGAIVTLYTAEGSNTETELYWGSDGFVWNDDGDTAYLYNSGGYQVGSLKGGATHTIEATTHTIGIKTVDTSGNINPTWVNDSATTSSASSGGGGGGGSTSKKSTGGGGGGAGSAEDYANVAIKDVDSEYLRMNANVIYEFTREGNPIQSVSFYSLKNSGEITSTIEVLNNRSKLVNSGPEGLVYKYVNIWVGKSGFATAANIKDGRVKFKVSNSWIKDMGVSPADVKLQRFNGTAWEVLPTTMDSNTTGYTMFEARTPGFSPFAITAERAVVASVTGETGTTPIQTENVGVEGTQPEKSRIWTFVLAVLIIGVFAVGYVYLKSQQGVINMGLVKTILKWLLIIFVVLVLLGIFLGGPSDQPTKSANQQQQESADTAAQKDSAGIPKEYDSASVREYEIIGLEDISIKALEKPLSEYSLSELNNLPMNVRMQYRVLMPVGISEVELKSTMIQVVLDETSKNKDIDEISVVAYDRKEDANGIYTLGMLKWCPNGKWEGVTAKIASSNDRSSYEYNLEIKDKVTKPDSIERPTEKEFEIYDYYQAVYSEENEKLDFSDPYAIVDYNIVYQRVADKFGITKEEAEQIVKKVAYYNLT